MIQSTDWRLTRVAFSSVVLKQDYADLAKSSLLGDGFNTWFDKCLNLSSFANGWVGNNIEHSAIDAMVTALSRCRF